MLIPNRLVKLLAHQFLSAYWQHVLMLLVVLLCFNWWAGVSPTGPTVHFYVRHIKESEWWERGWRQMRVGVQELKWPCRPGTLPAPAFIFHCHTAPFHPFLVWFLLSFPCLYLLCIIFSPACVCPLSCGLHLSSIIISVSLFAWSLAASALPSKKTSLSHFFSFH